ncbi:MAG: hypothetical protein ACO29Y_05960 [Holophagaceae bacterium]
MPTPRPFNAPVGFRPRIDPLGQIQRDLEAARQAVQRFQGARTAVPGATNSSVAAPPSAATPGRPGLAGALGLGIAGGQILAPLAVGLGNWFRSPQGQDFKRSIQPENILQTITSATTGRPANAATLQQYNPPGFDPNAAVSTRDLLDTARSIGIVGRDIGGDGSSDEARALTSQYAPKPFPLTPEGQFGRYFGGSEMDQYFGAASRGKGAPKTAEEALTLASGKGTPEGVGIATKYRAESAMGRGNMDEIVAAMGYKGSPMEQWARNNPMLAFREYNKKFPAGELTTGPTTAALQPSEGPMKAFGEEVKTFFPGAEPQQKEGSVGDRTDEFLKNLQGIREYSPKPEQPFSYGGYSFPTL